MAHVLKGLYNLDLVDCQGSEASIVLALIGWPKINDLFKVLDRQGPKVLQVILRSTVWIALGL